MGFRRQSWLSTLTLCVLFIGIWGVHIREPRYKSYQECYEESLEKREEEANVVITGTVKGLYPDYEHPQMMKAQVEVKRVLKGNNVINTLPGMTPYHRSNNRNPWNRRVVTVDGIGDPNICDSYARKFDTRIFMMDTMGNGELKLKSSLMRLTLNNIDRADAAVQDKPFVPKPTPPEYPCETHYCAFGAQCMVDEFSNDAFCKCLEKCTDLFAPVCGNDGVTYTSECHLRVASCSQQRRIVVSSQGACNVKNPCLDKPCSFGADCVPSLDGLTARCQCPERCDSYGDSTKSHPVCGDNGEDYANECELRRVSCEHMKEIKIKYPGKCDPCQGVTCPMNEICQLGADRNTICNCNNMCPVEFAPVCGSDGRTYSNECMMRVEACKSRKEIRILYHGECPNGNNPCTNLACDPFEECYVNRQGVATCTCPPLCEPVLRPVCGSDDITYDNECELKRTSCVKHQAITIQFVGKCSTDGHGPCNNYRCRYGAMCVVRDNNPHCECRTCRDNFQPVCGTDGVSYQNECKLNAENCEKQKKVRVASTGLCNGCDKKKCDFYGVCEGDGRGGTHCICPGTCVQVKNEVCGTDSVTYLNECTLRLASCRQQEYIVIASHGACDMCADVRCPFGARCENGNCVCPQDCSSRLDLICASDHKTYGNECEMRRQACAQGSELEVEHSGPCDDEIPGSGEGSGMEDCDDASCQFGGTCDSDGSCSCNFNCEAIRSPVCGSDEMTYGNECQMREESCRKQMDITMVPMENCEDMYEELCDGNAALVDTSTGREYDCRDGRDTCPAGSYCHRVSGVSRCCKEDEPIKSCSETRYGCCGDGRTVSPGLNFAGCPETCQCNHLGSFSRTCDPLTRQCTCKPGVGGYRCDRCEAGFWGLKLIPDGNSGCIPCGCSIYGSIRDDCHQSTGRCVCKPGIEGQKCQECSNGKMLGPGGCTDVSPPKRPCQELDCRYGATCVMNNGYAECICSADCSSEEYPLKVCGTDGQTYGSACQLRQMGCRLEQDLDVAYEGECTGPGPATRSPIGGRPRKTTRHVNGKTSMEATTSTPYGTIDDFCIEDGDCFVKYTFCKSGICTCERAYEPNRRRTACEVVTTATTVTTTLTTTNPTTTTTEAITEEDPCIPNYCLNGGTCRPRRKGGFRCKCPDMISGPLCEDIVQSAESTMASPTTASEITTTESTTTTAETTSELVTTVVDPCSSDPCQNGGKCRPQKKDGFRCKCPEGIEGSLCEKVIEPPETTTASTTLPATLPQLTTQEAVSSDPCSPNPCLNAGKCKPKGKGARFRCRCMDGTSGKRCQDVLLDPEVSDTTSELPVATEPLISTGPTEFPNFSSMMMSDQGVISPVEMTTATNYIVPSFSQDSYMQLTKISNSETKTSIEMDFRASSNDGILLYNGQNNDARGDFISLAIKDGYVEFRFDLGTGSAILRTREKIMLNSFHRVIAKRHGKEAMLQLDDNQAVSGTSAGSLKSLNLGTSLYLGSVPEASEIVLKSIGVFVGFSGCIESLKVETEKTKEYDLMYPASRDIEAEEGISECGENPCSSLPCQNGATCVKMDAENYECNCPDGYHGAVCNEAGDKEEGSTGCQPNPCENGGTCVDAMGGYFCTCPSGRDGDNCEKEAVSDVTVPEMHGHSYLEVRLHKTPNHAFKFELWFMASKPDGLLMYAVQEGIELEKADFLSVNLVDSYLQFRYDCGSGMADIVSPDKITLNVWHKVEVSRKQKDGMMVIDDDLPVTGSSQGDLNQLNLPKRLFIGGYPGDYHPSSGATVGLRGAVQRFHEEGVRVDDLVGSALSQKHIRQYHGEPCTPFDNPCNNAGICLPNLNDYECLCLEGYLGRTCDIDASTVNTDGPVSFDGRTHHRYPNKISTKQKGQSENEYEVRFRTTSDDDGLLLLQHKSADVKGDYLAVAIANGYAEISYNLGKEALDNLYFLRSDVLVNDGQWHTLLFSRDKRKGTLRVDGGMPVSSVSSEGVTQLDTDGNLWIGGASNVPKGLPIPYYLGFIGCIESIHIDGEELLLVENRISNDDIQFCNV